MAQNNSVFFFRKFQTTVVEGQTQELTQTCNKSEITVFYMEKNSKFTGSLYKFLIPIFLESSVLWYTVLQN